LSRDSIEVRGLRVVGTHGVLPEERARAQPFEVDIDIAADLSEAGASDDVTATIDYGPVVDAVAAEVAGPHAELLEHLAERIAARVLTVAGSKAATVTVTLRKLRPPLAHDVESVGVRVTRP
jgi:dihydroneopterin aldolase/2-amino-4-hydroxy-6-hydroxymethyldihydropteridine diphosphokinase